MKKIPTIFGYERTKKVAKSIYRKIGKVVCPILDGEEIHFNAKGNKHFYSIMKKETKKSP